MGFGGISIWQLLILLVIVLLLFGTKKLRNIGSDLGGAVKGFRGAMKEGEEQKKKEQEQAAEKLEQADDVAAAGKQETKVEEKEKS